MNIFIPLTSSVFIPLTFLCTASSEFRDILERTSIDICSNYCVVILLLYFTNVKIVRSTRLFNSQQRSFFLFAILVFSSILIFVISNSRYSTFKICQIPFSPHLFTNIFFTLTVSETKLCFYILIKRFVSINKPQ